MRSSLYALAFACFCSSQYVGTPDINVWPLPQNFSSGGELAAVIPGQFSFVKQGTVSSIDSSLLDQFTSRYQTLIFEPHATSDGPAYVQDLFNDKRVYKPYISPTRVITVKLLGMNIAISQQSVPLSIGVDESYSLFVPGSTGCGGSASCLRWVSLNATTVWGVLRGLETFSQLVTYELLPKGDLAYVVSAAPVSIMDFPRFAWRGVMVDSSRHFLPLSSLRATVDAMQYNKLNILHWHLTDAESFAFHSASRPLLNLGSYSPNAQYNASDIINFLEYARVRGVIVIPETDTPGHTASWAKGYPEILTDCWDWIKSKYPSFFWPGFDSIPLDVTKNITFEVVSDVVSEIIGAFSAPFYHIGGDEVIFGCWNASESIKDWMQENGYANQTNSTEPLVYDFDGLQHMWTLKMLDLLASLNRTGIVWDEALTPDHPINSDTIINVWNGVDALKTALSMGHRTVVSYGYYLDRQAPLGAGPNCGNVHYMWMWTWHDFYLSDPLGWFDVPIEQQALVLGGEMSAWGESVSEYNLQERIWSRGPAVSERFWSNASVRDIDDAQQRLGRFWCRMQGRGIRAAPSMPGFCSSYLSSDSSPKPPRTPPADTALIVLAIVCGVLALITIFLLFDRCRKKKPSDFMRDGSDESLNYNTGRA